MIFRHSISGCGSVISEGSAFAASEMIPTPRSTVRCKMYDDRKFSYDAPLIAAEIPSM
jgi:hypothetical protein